MEIKEICKLAKVARREVAKLSSKVKDKILVEVAKELVAQKDNIIEVNKKDIKKARENGVSEALIDRLLLTEKRIYDMATSLDIIANTVDPIGEVVGGYRVKSGIHIEKTRVPIGVIGIIYEARPNVTIDAAALCLKASNVSILRGSAMAINTNKYLADLFISVGMKNGLPKNAINLIEDESRDSLNDFIVQDEYIDVLIPRGGKSLKEFIVKNGTIPVIVTGAGTCHTYIDYDCDIKSAIDIVVNEKTQRPSTCNSLECLLVNENQIENLYKVIDALLEEDVTIHLEKNEHLDYERLKNVDLCQDEYYGVEFLSKEIFIKIVKNIEQAINYIDEYSTKHSECICTKDLGNAQKFLDEVDSACVYLNASTRFSDGGEFGFGGEIGISTQKLHARGPMGVKELTSTKYIIRGNGEIR